MTTPNTAAFPEGGQPTPVDPVATPAAKKKGCGTKALIGVGVVIVLAVLGSLFGGGDKDTDNTTTTSTTTTTSEVAPAEEATPVEQATQEQPPAQPPTEEATPVQQAPAQSVTREQRNALRQAEHYLSFTAFSEKGLREQLEYHGYPADAVQYALDNITVDWNEQAVKKAREYDKHSPMSDNDMLEQLLYEGFTPEQAQYGVSNM